MLNPNLSFMESVDLVLNHGFSNIEFWGWEGKDLDQLEKRVQNTKMSVTNFSGHRNSSPVDERKRDDFLSELSRSIEVAQDLNCSNLMVLSNALNSDNSAVVPSAVSQERQLINLKDSLAEAVNIAADSEITLLLENLNPIDHPGYLLNDPSLVFEVIRAIDNPHLKALLDVYHLQRSHGDVINFIRSNAEDIGYVHIADSPDRSEPGTGELNLSNILEELKQIKCLYVGFEYRPLQGPENSLKSIKTLI